MVLQNTSNYDIFCILRLCAGNAVVDLTGLGASEHLAQKRQLGIFRGVGFHGNNRRRRQEALMTLTRVYLNCL
jgi:hypothetical protein